MTTNSDLRKHKRQLRMRIGRMRRRIDGRLHSARRSGRRLLSWREYVTRYPTYAMLIAFGAGLAASSRPGRGHLMGKLGLMAMRHAAGRLGQELWRQFLDAWAGTGAKS